MAVPILHFYKQRGCPFCIEGQRYLDEFLQKHYADVVVIPHHADILEWPIEGWSPSGFPAYALVVDGGLLKVHEGVLKPNQLTNFIDPTKAQRPPRSRRRATNADSDLEVEEDEEDEEGEGEEE